MREINLNKKINIVNKVVTVKENKSNDKIVELKDTSD